MNSKATILTGDHPTGPLHLGHYMGSLRQHATLQYDYQQFILVADLQGLTDSGSTPQKIRNNIPEVFTNYLIAGTDPSPTTICLQSALPALTELTVLYMDIVTVARVGRNPTVKNEIAQKGFARSLPVDLLVYPVSQTVDITAFKAEIVPVGDDQLPMIGQTNKIVHKMNDLLPAPALSHCKTLLSETSRLPRVDGGTKMSESLGSTSLLSASEETIHRAASAMYADSDRLKVSDPGQTDGNMAFTYPDVSHPDKAKVAGMKTHYQRGGLDDRACKNELKMCLQELTAPMREWRATYIQGKGMLVMMLKRGSGQVHEITQQALRRVKQGLDLPVF